MGGVDSVDGQSVGGAGGKKPKKEKFVFRTDALGCENFPAIRQQVISLYERIAPMFVTYGNGDPDKRVFLLGFEGILQCLFFIFSQTACFLTFVFWVRIVSFSYPFICM